ncbi:MAG: D-alanyl-D-alanine carboxypeptidase family protein [Dehalococcoidia bacterium]|nr:D-alanyl-D-alanine carboxypeptidase family protein [Dehalococcoidia bacterium]
MATPRYGYPPRRRRPRPRGWWLVLPLMLVVGAVALNSRLPDGGGALLTARTKCEGEGCETAVLSAQPCAGGGACADSQVAPDAFHDTVPVQITGRAAAVIEEPCGGVLYEMNAGERLAPASITKIATALVAAERSDLSEIVDVEVDGAALAVETESTIMGLQPGLDLSMRDLLYGLLLPSGNDAAIAIAEHVAGSVPAFVELMNEKADELGLRNTHFVNPHGLDDPDHYTSAHDIAVLGLELLRRPELAEIVRTMEYQPAWDRPAFSNGNRLLFDYPESIGIKIGFTDKAGQTIVAAAERGGRRIIVSLLGSSTVYQDAIALFEWAFSDTTSACRGLGGQGG